MSTTAPVALVTGGNRGIGHETARQLAGLGYTVLLSARRPEDAERAVAGMAPAVPGTLVPCRLDVTDADSVRALARRVEGEFGRLDVLVNNAAISSTTRPSTTTPPAEPSPSTSARSATPWRPTSSAPGRPPRRSCRCCAAHPTLAW
ncbi:SDR family NAD(P)-dependent oxidoreductase [Streptomyces katrae]|uniref:SDR family NAD(P)-dependent oxidoreductase n=1 Tax=Streptomyces katrae TaxID=68223 RepID=UPI003CCBC2F4